MSKELVESINVVARCRFRGCDWAESGILRIIENYVESAFLSDIDPDLHKALVKHHRSTRNEAHFGHEYYYFDTEDGRRIVLECHDYFAVFKGYLDNINDSCEV